MGQSVSATAGYSLDQKVWAIQVPEGWAVFSDQPLFQWHDCIREAPDGLVLEFGVRAGETIRQIAACGRKVYGFDWWKGLPHDWGVTLPRGGCLAAKPQVPDNVELIEGLFSDTLEDFLLAHPEPVAFVNLDCDLFTSTLYVLNCLRPRFIKGSLIAFSAMSLFCDLEQRRAFDRFDPTGWECVGKQHAFGEVYRCVS